MEEHAWDICSHKEIAVELGGFLCRCRLLIFSKTNKKIPFCFAQFNKCQLKNMTFISSTTNRMKKRQKISVCIAIQYVWQIFDCLCVRATRTRQMRHFIFVGWFVFHSSDMMITFDCDFVSYSPSGCLIHAFNVERDGVPRKYITLCV